MAGLVWAGEEAKKTRAMAVLGRPSSNALRAVSGAAWCWRTERLGGACLPSGCVRGDESDRQPLQLEVFLLKLMYPSIPCTVGESAPGRARHRSQSI